jgi:nucleotide-binding universal stress UspA family protein
LRWSFPMSDEKLKHIVCAVRGGPESRDTVTRAVNLALETGARLTFFHVLDAEFLQYATVGPLSVVYSELAEMAKFAMLIVCDRAERRGVTQVDFILREGNIAKALLNFVAETRAEVLVIGRPTRSPGRNVFRVEELETLGAELERVGQIQVIQVTPAGHLG